MSTMTANFRVANPVQIASAREKPVEKETSGGDERFANLLSQRHAAREETAPSQHAPALKPKEPAKPKESRPDDTLRLLHRSAEIQPSVTPPPQNDPQTQTQPTAAAVDDVLSTSAKPASPPVVALPVVPLDPPVADANAQVATSAPTQTPPLPPPDSTPALTPTATSSQSSAAPKPQAAIPAVPSPDDVQEPVLAEAVSKAAVPLHAFKPTVLAASAPPPTEAQPAETTATPAPLPPLPQTDTPAPTATAAKPVDTINLQGAPAIPSSQPDFSNAAPIILASTVAATAHHSHADSSDDTLDGIDSTTPIGAIPVFSLHETHDIGSADGKTPVPTPSSPEFGDALGTKLSWMAERHIGHAEIRLSPDNLGTVDVRVHLNGDRVRAEFSAANPEVRQAINDHIPRLRDMLARHGFDLTQSHVGNGSEQRNPSSAQSDFREMVDDDVALPAPRLSAYAHDGILDAFA